MEGKNLHHQHWLTGYVFVLIFFLFLLKSLNAQPPLYATDVLMRL